eukprot:CAMPEP_0205919814 /NCGR_PEP_ID=MMETSP1325-20131115/10678_1 /ASSEMBLY_ACC=CAM_ASM_000708 /TAXON_ID=236786 /ORGANISM="Florenciella sp., Strain RCC1007" /LENGTH=83 /DNA_ID=CAMNT_0053287453 /DNA_START=205 /DNA_END=456 /DNA_ORIENTATION=+
MKAIQSLPPPAHPAPPPMIPQEGVPVMMVGAMEEEDKRKAYEAHIAHAKAKIVEARGGDGGELVGKISGEEEGPEGEGVGVEF